MAIVTKLHSARRTGACKITGKYKRAAHRAYRRTAKIAIKSEREINEKPRLTGWDLV